jgi:hypothetical protein
VVRQSGKTHGNPRLKVSSGKVLVLTMKPSDDGRGTYRAAFGASGKTERVKLAWFNPSPRQLWISDTSEQKKEKSATRSKCQAGGL